MSENRTPEELIRRWRVMVTAADARCSKSSPGWRCSTVSARMPEAQALLAEWDKRFWIALRDEHPQERQMVLIYSPSEGITTAKFCGANLNTRSQESTQWINPVSGDFYPEPTFWMPLPEPPTPTNQRL